MKGTVHISDASSAAHAPAPPATNGDVVVVAAKEGEAVRRAVEAAVDARMQGIEAALERLQLLADGFPGSPNPLGESFGTDAGEVPEAIARVEQAASGPLRNAGSDARPPAEPILVAVAFTPRTERILLEWAKVLIEHAGREGFSEAIAYFESLGWIGHDVRVRLARIGAGLVAPETGSVGQWRLTPHTFERSLACIEELQGMG